jgi:hypothetical protein
MYDHPWLYPAPQKSPFQWFPDKAFLHIITQLPTNYLT